MTASARWPPCRWFFKPCKNHARSINSDLIIRPPSELFGRQNGDAVIRGDFPHELATNAEPENVDFILGGAGLLDCFQALVDGHQVSRPKPDPEVFLTAAQRLGVDPTHCVVFEDSPGGMQAARAAGARVVGLLTTLQEAPLADLSIPNFLDPGLLPWLQGLPTPSMPQR